jgi:imidazolonepropionase-like amidohydrolase
MTGSCSAAARLGAACVALAAVAAPVPASAQVAVRAGLVYTVAGPPIQDGVVVIRDGKIAAVGSGDRTRIPDGMPVIEARVVTPGLVDAHSVVGMSGILNVDHDQDQLDRGDAIQPELRAVDAFNVREPLVDWLRGLGVTTVHTGHGPGTIVSGQTLIAKTWGRTAEEAILRPEAMVAATLGGQALDARPGKSPGTRAKAIAMLRGKLIEAQRYARQQGGKDASKRPGRDLRLETLGRVLARELPLLVTVHRHQDILAALRLAREFDIRIVLDGAAEAHLLVDAIRAAEVPVILHPTMLRADADDDTDNISMETAARLHRAGIPFAIQSGYESYVPKTRVVLFEAAVATAYGLPHDAALAAITLDAARILGIADRVGSIERGKDGDLALFDGDPFEYTTHCTGVVLNGVHVESTPR